MEEKSWRSNHGGVIMQGIWRQKHSGGTQEAPRRHPGGPQEAPSSSAGCPQNTQRHPKDTQRHPGARRETRGVCDVKWVKTIEFYKKTR